MDYEKKYKEALERAKAVLEIAANKEEAEGYVSTIFPELKESEDERIRKELLAVVNDLVLPDEQQSRFVSWLEKQGEQNLDWSEEDECYMGECISAIATKDSWSFEEKRKTKHWLKSLKDRYTWKPSEEQMRALHDLNLTGNISYAGQGQVLINLYNDLKKLKGE